MATTNVLLETLTDTVFSSVDGYRKAADTAKTPALKQILSDQASKRQATLNKLNAELQRVGGNLVTEGTLTGEVHKFWLSLTSMFENGDEAATERVEEGERYLVKKFEEAIDSGVLEDGSKAVVSEALTEIRESNSLAKQLADKYDD